MLLVFLFAYPRIKSGGGGSSSGVPCLVPNLPLLQHIHPVLKIEIDGANEPLPSEIGLRECERAVHTHDDDVGRGVIHVESQDRREYTLHDFFGVWGKTIEREGYTLEATVDGAPLADPAGLIFKDGQQIVLKYTKQ